ncbi:MAG: Uma2 family endonuclease [Arcicella sp.]|nr:Uma2 family endonuclease [Arcicella sp.]
MVAVASLSESIVERLEEKRIIFIPASLEEYWDVLEEMADEPYTLEYINGEIKAKSKQETDNHEVIVSNIGAILRNIYLEKEEYRAMASAKTVYVPDCEMAFNPDALVMKGESVLFPRKRKVAGITNPYILVEIHSDSTKEFDMKKKLPCYKKLESIHQIIYIEQNTPYITIYIKNQDNQHWFNDDFDDLNGTIRIDSVDILMKEIYHKERENNKWMNF